MEKVLMALDQGTTSSRAIVFSKTGRVLGAHGIEFAQRYPQPGWVEHDPFDILTSQIEAMRYAVQKAGISAEQVACIGITNQRETTMLWDRTTGKPLYNAIVWQCRRTALHCEALAADGWEGDIRKRTGLVLDAYFSGTKLGWMLDNVDGARKRAEAGELCFGTVDSWLLWNLCEGRPHKTDATNASRTLLFNIHSLGWDDELLRMLSIPRAVLPEVVDSSAIVGTLRSDILGCPIPIAAMVGDQHAALYGQTCFAPGMAKNTYGTGCFLLMNTGEAAVASKHKLLTTMAWLRDGKPTYALEGSVFVAGAAIQWLRDEMGFITTAAESEALAASVPDTGGVAFVPAFTGLGAPYWDGYGRGALVGLTRGTSRAHIARATLEAIAHQSMDVIEAMEGDAPIPLKELRVDGGASQNNLLMQMQADLSGRPILRPAVVETTALGAAMLAALAVGEAPSQESLSSLWTPDTVFFPKITADERLYSRARWKRAVERARDWARE